MKGGPAIALNLPLPWNFVELGDLGASPYEEWRSLGSLDKYGRRLKRLPALLSLFKF
jgi:hypothetical protein